MRFHQFCHLVVFGVSLCLLAPFVGCGVPSAEKKSIEKRGFPAHLLIYPLNAALAKGSTLQLTAKVVGGGEPDQDVSTAVTWSTSNGSIVTVNKTGQISATNIGTAEILAVYQTISGQSNVNVGPAALTSIAVAPNASSLPVGETEQMTAAGTYTDGSQQNLTQSVTWSSSSSIVAGVTAQGITTALSMGTTSINAALGSMSGASQLIVTAPVAIALSIVPGSLSVVLGNQSQLHAIATYSDNSAADVTTQAQWTSSAPNVVSVSSGGMTQAQNVGSSTITAADTSLDATANISVSPLALVRYYDLADGSKTNIDGTIRIVNPGFQAGNLCAMVYVFDQSQEMNECCGCSLSDSALLTLSLENDLTNNTLTGKKSTAGLIKIVPADSSANPTCNAGTPSPNGLLLAWGTDAQMQPGATPQPTESQLDFVPLTTAETSVLAGECSAIQTLGSGRGVCSCGKN
jgi:hypothetical protein